MQFCNLDIKEQVCLPSS